MVIALEKPFLGPYERGYLQVLKDGRKYVYLYKSGKRRLISNARYMYSVFQGEEVAADLEVDHINNDRTDDRIENLQLLTKADNIKKSAKKPRIVTLVCPVCHKEFEYQVRNLSTHTNPCCSRSCGAKKGHPKRDIH